MFRSLIAVCLAITSVVASAEATKIAVVDRQRAALETVVAKERRKSLAEDADFIANKNDYDQAVAAVKELYAKAQKEGPTMSQAEQAELAAKIQEKEADVKHVMTKIQAAEQNLARDILKNSNAKLSKAIQQLIEKKQIGLLLPSESALYATGEYDITAEVTELMNTL